MTVVCSSLVFGAVTRLRSSGLGFPHPPRGDFRGSERGRQEGHGRRRSTQLRRCLCTRRAR